MSDHDAPGSLAAFDAAVDRLPPAAFGDELAALETWGEPVAGVAPRAERVAVIREGLAEGHSLDAIRAQRPAWWAMGSSTATERMWHRDRIAAQTQPESPAKEPKMGRGTNQEVSERREALRNALPATSAEVRERLDVYVGRDIGLLTGDMRAIGAVRGPGKVWAIEDVPAPKKPRAARNADPGVTIRRTRKPELTVVAPVRPSLADAARVAIRQANDEGAPLYLDHEFVAALHGRLIEAGL